MNKIGGANPRIPAGRRRLPSLPSVMSAQNTALLEALNADDEEAISRALDITDADSSPPSELGPVPRPEPAPESSYEIDIQPLDIDHKRLVEYTLKKIKFINSNDTVDDNQIRNRRQLDEAGITITQVIDFLNLIILSATYENDRTKTLVNKRIYNMTENIRNKFDVKYKSWAGTPWQQDTHKLLSTDNKKLRSIYNSGYNDLEVLKKETGEYIKFNDYALQCIELQGIFPLKISAIKLINFLEIKPGKDYSINYEYYYQWEMKGGIFGELLNNDLSTTEIGPSDNLYWLDKFKDQNGRIYGLTYGHSMDLIPRKSDDAPGVDRIRLKEIIKSNLERWKRMATRDGLEELFQKYNLSSPELEIKINQEYEKILESNQKYAQTGELIGNENIKLFMSRFPNEELLKDNSGTFIKGIWMESQYTSSGMDTSFYVSKEPKRTIISLPDIEDIIDPELQEYHQQLMTQQSQETQSLEIVQQLERQAAQIREKITKGMTNPKLEIIKRRLKLYNKNEIPDEFKCQITRDIMSDPVITVDGHSYEREAIQQWLSLHNTSPKTGVSLYTTRLFPNHALRSRIENWSQGYSPQMEGGYFDF
jgi:hypothetical protein